MNQGLKDKMTFSSNIVGGATSRVYKAFRFTNHFVNDMQTEATERQRKEIHPNIFGLV